MALAGCARHAERAAGPSDDAEAGVRQAFAELQATVKAGDIDRLWNLLSDKSQADAERRAESIREAYAKADPAEKAQQEKDTGLSGVAQSQLTGKGFLKTQRFQRKFEDLPSGNINQIVIDSDRATVHYTESDGDKEKAIFIRQNGEWRAWLTMPSASGVQD
jgi:hypothetical protein